MCVLKSFLWGLKKLRRIKETLLTSFTPGLTPSVLCIVFSSLFLEHLTLSLLLIALSLPQTSRPGPAFVQNGEDEKS